ncbi:cell death-inducing p53-target protein 1 homolog [Gigantopelta aegis]|uniref:cell death-inducing p53-target protein 1 homolog n=1 Tax=Gigantopelta aegis TaxID=1735272 RepID=UPI001B8893B8|nr:cell death-inducing p53-target protein 1 homolog [Gigantopelta aegis]
MADSKQAGPSSDPADHPSNPVDHPSNPVDHPSNPVDHPSNPAVPPSNPAGPPPGYTTQPGQPAYTTQPGQPAYTTQPGQPAYGTQPGQRAYGTQPGQPAYGTQPGQPAYGIQPGQPMYPAQPGQPIYQGQPPPYQKQAGVHVVPMQGPYIAQTHTVVVTQPGIVGPRAVPGSTCRYQQHQMLIICQHCSATVKTTTTYEVGLLTWAAAGLICVFGFWLGCCLIPFCIDAAKDVSHTCPSCGQLCGKFQHFS